MKVCILGKHEHYSMSFMGSHIMTLLASLKESTKTATSFPPPKRQGSRFTQENNLCDDKLSLSYLFSRYFKLKEL